MSHTYPLGKTARDALAKAEQSARTRYEAEDLVAETHEVLALETEWLTPKAKQLQTWLDQADANPAQGFVQRYEDADGQPVLAVTYWKTRPKRKAVIKQFTDTPPRPETVADHTDDLYFRQGRTKTRKRPPKLDPNQMDLFGGSAKPDKPNAS